MFELTIDAEFCAAHALSIAGVREPVHGHNWRVTVTVAGPTLDADGLLCDFHTVQGALDSILEPLHNADLNALAAFARVNPTAENVAQHIATRLSDALDEPLAPHARVAAVRVTEAPGCAATYRVGR
jgi:6-pyruvoyltetrahydropterin/6-carboxytetrahydropterin synthase